MRNKPLTNGQQITITDIKSISVFDADPRLMNQVDDGVFCKVLKIHRQNGETIVIQLFGDEARYLNVRRGDRI